MGHHARTQEDQEEDLVRPARRLRDRDRRRTGFDSGTDTGIGFIVAAAGFDSGFGVADTGFQGTVAAMGFEAGDAPFGVADVSFTVAAMGFDSGPPADAGEG